MDMSIEEFSSLSSKMEDRMVRIAELERQLAEEKEHSRGWSSCCAMR